MKRIISLLLAAVLMLSCFPVTASAATYSGSCGKNLTWKFNTSTGALTISGTGAMTDYGYALPPWQNYTSSIKTITISNGVTSIGDSAFAGCDITSITIPDSVTRIGDNAFQMCFSLTSIKLGNGLTSIGNWVFSQCSLSSINIPASVTSIGEGVFSWCGYLSQILVDGSSKYFTSVEGVLFNKAKSKLIAYPSAKSGSSYTIPSSVTSIHPGAFWGNNNLSSITLPKNITRIDESAFYSCYGLSDITIPSGVTSIGNGAFAECMSLKNITIPNSLKEIGTGAFDGCFSLTDVYYSGTKTQKKKIRIEEYNESLIDATWHYNSIAAPYLSVTVNTTTGKPKLSWNKVAGAEKYRLYRATSKNGKYTLIKTTMSSTTYTDTTAKAGKNYYYKVRALDTDTDTYSKYSNIVNRCCDLAKPTVSIKLNSGDPKVTWKKVSGATKYRIYRATSKNGTYKLIKTTTKTGYTDTTAKAGKTYYYKVKAIHSNSAANSAYSSVKSIKAK